LGVFLQGSVGLPNEWEHRTRMQVDCAALKEMAEGLKKSVI
jgi:hypothetical protein